MRKLMFVTAFIFIMAIYALAVTPAIAGPTVKIYQLGGYSYGNGGEFTATPINWSWNPLQYYSDSTKDQAYSPSFQTFCLETSEYFSPGREYDVLFGDEAIKGGVGPQGDPISLGTAWLYHEFQKGTLQGYDYDTTDGDRSVSAGALQNAIWYLEGEGGSLNAAYTTLLTSKFGGIANAMLNNAGTYPVAVMTLWDKGYAGDLNHRAQDMLVCVPAPGAILLGGIGTCLVGWLRRGRSLL